jgi:hypothetical protein
MKEQLAQLGRVASEDGNVTVQVLPRVRGARGRRRRVTGHRPAHRATGAGRGAPGRDRRRGVPGGPGRHRRLRAGVRAAARVRAQPGPIRAAAARYGRRLTPSIAGAPARTCEGAPARPAAPPFRPRLPAEGAHARRPAWPQPRPLPRERGMNSARLHPRRLRARARRAARRGADPPRRHRGHRRDRGHDVRVAPCQPTLRRLDEYTAHPSRTRDQQCTDCS